MHIQDEDAIGYTPSFDLLACHLLSWLLGWHQAQQKWLAKVWRIWDLGWESRDLYVPPFPPISR